MHRFIDGEDRMQPALLPHSLEDYGITSTGRTRFGFFIEELDLAALGFLRMTQEGKARRRD